MPFWINEKALLDRAGFRSVDAVVSGLAAAALTTRSSIGCWLRSVLSELIPSTLEA
jgi:hypothetical protein